MNCLLGVGLAVLVLLQTTGTAPIRIGTNAGLLTERDLTELLAVPGVANPWLMDARTGQIGEFVRIFLPPTSVTSNLRRGTAIVAVRNRFTPEGERWRASVERNAYAQVAVEGRSMDQVERLGDLAQPFFVTGSFTDDELLSIVRLIRSKPTAPLTNTLGQSGPVAGDLPINIMVRTHPGTVNVLISRNSSESQDVTLQREGSGWIVLAAKWGVS
jgi:hypothetical protein